MPADITADSVLSLILEQQIIESAEPVTVSTDLFALGMDSMAMMQLLLHIEDRFGIAITPGDVTRDHFATASAMAQLLAERRT